MIHTDIHFKELLRKILPSFLRTPTRILWLETLASPLEKLFEEFKDYRKKKEFEARMTGQTLLLQEYLNRSLDAEQRRILIKHRQDAGRYLPRQADKGYEKIYFLLLEEKDQDSLKGLDPYFHLRIDENHSAFSDVDFLVCLPNESDAQKAKIIINRYKIAGKSFTIKQN